MSKLSVQTQSSFINYVVGYTRISTNSKLKGSSLFTHLSIQSGESMTSWSYWV